MTLLRSGSATDTGLVRSVNQDLAIETANLFAVADGMGGHAGGEVAARMAVDAVTSAFSRQPTGAGLAEAVTEANTVVWQHSLENPELRGMGTTLTAVGLVNEDGRDVLALVNVGDSRSYRFHDGEITQLTTDHSLAEEMVRSGELTSGEAAVHPHRHILTRALGVSADVNVDLWRIQPVRGDRFLLCSDGLTNELDSDQISEVLSSVTDPGKAAELLVQAARTHGGSDNITAVVIDVVVGDGRRLRPGGGRRGSRLHRSRGGRRRCGRGRRRALSGLGARGGRAEPAGAPAGQATRAAGGPRTPSDHLQDPALRDPAGRGGRRCAGRRPLVRHQLLLRQGPGQ